ncbi:MAG: hypothetical protein MR413_07175 [Clostridia bacterium]|nr:hypothetical protein [Clostridia bacterium]
MAEKYGEVPQKWTKEWWGYFWDYYKLHTIITLFVIICVAITVTQCVTREKYDITMTYAGHKIYTDDEISRAAVGLSQYIDDVDGNGEKSIFFQQLNFVDQMGSEEYDYASQTKLDLEFHNECSFLFLYDASQTELMINRDSASELYVPVSEWADTMPEQGMLYSKDGVAYAVKLDNSAFLEENSIYNDDLYVLIRRNYADDEKNALASESSIRIANVLIQ